MKLLTIFLLLAFAASSLTSCSMCETEMCKTWGKYTKNCSYCLFLDGEK